MIAHILRWLSGELNGAERVWTSVGPALALIAYFAVAGIIYAVRSRLVGSFHDEEMDQRGQGGLTVRGLRHFFAWTMRPWWKYLAAVRFPPNAITSLSFAFALGAGLSVAIGRFALGGWLFVSAGALDFLDGRVARTTGQATASGAALDSILDRYVESALIVGLSWYYRNDWVLAPCLLALTGSLLVPYVRARGEALGVSLKDVGFMQRPERVIALGAGTALSPILEVLLSPNDAHPPHRLAIAALVLVALTSHGTTLQRLWSLVRALDTRANGTGAAVAVGAKAARPLKTIAASAVATVADFVVASSLFFALSGHPSLVTALGCVAGALVSFGLSRLWAFEAGGAILPQASRYAFVSLATAGLNAGGVAVLGAVHIPFFASWAIARAVIFATWSYPLYRDFVFVEAQGRPVVKMPETVVRPEPALASRP